MHGLAGSAVLVLITHSAVESRLAGLVYIVVFGIGSVIGMGVLSTAIAIPLSRARSVGWAYNGLCSVLGLVTFLMGFGLVYQITPAMVGLF